MSEVYDLVIIGSGPAGIAAAIYAKRARLCALVLEKAAMSGGQILTTSEVDNYPGFPGIGGYELGMKLREHAEALKAEFCKDEISEVRAVSLEDTELLAAAELADAVPDSGKLWRLSGKKDSYLARAVLIATGASHRKLCVPGEERLAGSGVSYCATCDGAFFRGKDVAVAGGGDVAAEDAIYLSRICRKVFLIHRRDELRAAKYLQERLFSLENISVIWDTAVEEICGQDAVESLRLRNKKTGEESHLPVDGIFIAVGIRPNSAAFEGLAAMEQGYIVADETCETNVPGIFAAGDVRTKRLRQIITAMADGANAVASAERYIHGFC